MKEVIEKKMTLEVCPTSNIQTNVVNSISDHPIRKLFDLVCIYFLNCSAKIGCFSHFSYFLSLFLSHKYVDGSAGIVPILAYLILEITFVRIFYPLRQVAEEDK